MKAGVLILVALLAAAPALAEDVPFNGRTLEVASDQEGRPILRMLGSRYALPRTQAELLERGRACLGGRDAVVIESEDAQQGLLVANVRTGFRAGFANRILRSRLTLEVGEGYFQFAESELALARASEDGDEVFAPLSRDEGPWEDALEALINSENQWVDCLYK